MGHKSKKCISPCSTPPGPMTMSFNVDAASIRLKATVTKDRVEVVGTCNHAECTTCVAEKLVLSRLSTSTILQHVCKASHCLPLDESKEFRSVDMMVCANAAEDKALLMEALKYLACTTDTCVFSEFKKLNKGEIPDIMVQHLTHVQVDLVCKFKNSVADHIAYDHQENLTHMTNFTHQPITDALALTVLKTMPVKTTVESLSADDLHRAFTEKRLAMSPSYASLLVHGFKRHGMTDLQIQEAVGLDMWLRRVECVGLNVVLVQMHQEQRETMFYINDKKHVTAFRTGKEKCITPLVITQNRALVCRRVQLASAPETSNATMCSGAETRLLEKTLSESMILLECTDAAKRRATSKLETVKALEDHIVDKDHGSHVQRVFVEKYLRKLLDASDWDPWRKNGTNDDAIAPASTSAGAENQTPKTCQKQRTTARKKGRREKEKRCRNDAMCGECKKKQKG